MLKREIFILCSLYTIYMNNLHSATDIASDLLRHQLIGARKKSWGLEMTILSALMRNMGHHSSLADLRMLRRLLAVGTALTPVVPGDALVTPVTFRARQRGLRGFLAEVDAREDGRRIIGGEWVVCRALWLRLQDQWRRAKRSTGAGADTAAHPTRAPNQSRVILFLHGGAYYMFSPATHRTVTIPLSMQTESRVFAVDYRLAPETRFPGQLHDAVLAYLRLIEDLDIPPGNVVVCGDSAGGGLALALLLYLRDNGYPMPSACVLMSPWVGETHSVWCHLHSD
jgi:acetyl esterase/lipase